MISRERFMDISVLHFQAFSLRDIFVEFGMHSKTVTKYVIQTHPPRYDKVKRKKSILIPNLQISEQCQQQHNYRSSWIYNQIKHIGYGGGYGTVNNNMRKVATVKKDRSPYRGPAWRHAPLIRRAVQAVVGKREIICAHPPQRLYVCKVKLLSWNVLDIFHHI